MTNIILTVINEADDLVDTGSGASVIGIALFLLMVFVIWLAYKRR